MKKPIVALTILLFVLVALSSTDIRIAQGEVTSRTHIEHPYYTNTWLTTTDGEDWIVENYEAPIGDKVLIIYDRCDKSTIYDDEIKYIIHFTDITK